MQISLQYDRNMSSGIVGPILLALSIDIIPVIKRKKLEPRDQVSIKKNDILEKVYEDVSEMYV